MSSTRLLGLETVEKFWRMGAFIHWSQELDCVCCTWLLPPPGLEGGVENSSDGCSSSNFVKVTSTLIVGTTGIATCRDFTKGSQEHTRVSGKKVKLIVEYSVGKSEDKLAIIIPQINNCIRVQLDSHTTKSMEFKGAILCQTLYFTSWMATRPGAQVKWLRAEIMIRIVAEKQHNGWWGAGMLLVGVMIRTEGLWSFWEPI